MTLTYLRYNLQTLVFIQDSPVRKPTRWQILEVLYIVRKLFPRLKEVRLSAKKIFPNHKRKNKTKIVAQDTCSHIGH